MDEATGPSYSDRSRRRARRASPAPGRSSETTTDQAEKKPPSVSEAEEGASP